MHIWVGSFPAVVFIGEDEGIFSQRFLDYRALFKWLLDYKATTKPQGSSPTPDCTYAPQNDEVSQDEVSAAGPRPDFTREGVRSAGRPLAGTVCVNGLGGVKVCTNARGTVGVSADLSLHLEHTAEFN